MLGLGRTKSIRSAFVTCFSNRTGPDRFECSDGQTMELSNAKPRCGWGKSEIYRTCSIHTSQPQQGRLAAIKMHVVWNSDDQSMTSVVDSSEDQWGQIKRMSMDRSSTEGGKRTERHESQRVERRGERGERREERGIDFLSNKGKLM